LKKVILNNLNDIKVVDDVFYFTESGVVLKNLICGVCSGELMDWYVSLKAPYTPGHEFVGLVVNKTDDIEKFKLGDKIFVHHHAPCLNCNYCKRREYVSCEKWRKSKVFPGGFSEYIFVPKEIINFDAFEVNDISDEDAALIEPLACSLKAIDKLGINEFDYIAVIGLGFMGLLNAKLSKIFGAKKVVGFDFYENRRKLAIDWAGIDEVYEPSNFNFKEFFSKIIVGPANKEAINFALKIADKGSKIVLFAPLPPNEAIELNINYIYFNEISIIPSYSSSHIETKKAYELIKLNFLKPSQLITHRFSIDEIKQAFKVARDPKAIKVIIDMQVMKRIFYLNKEVQNGY
jgi:L-iditol 2-dehydrogenase